MNREVLINIINRGGIRFIPVRRCFLCNEYVGYKFVRMCDGSMIPVFSSGCRCCGINNGTLSERTWDEVLDLVKTVQNKPMKERTEEVALEPMDLELYYEIGAGLMAVDPAAVESGTIWSPYTRELYHENHDT